MGGRGRQGQGRGARCTAAAAASCVPCLPPDPAGALGATAAAPPQTLKRQEEIQKELEGVGEDMDAMAEVGGWVASGRGGLSGCWGWCGARRRLRIPWAAGRGRQAWKGRETPGRGCSGAMAGSPHCRRTACPSPPPPSIPARLPPARPPAVAQLLDELSELNNRSQDLDTSLIDKKIDQVGGCQGVGVGVWACGGGVVGGAFGLVGGGWACASLPAWLPPRLAPHLASPPPPCSTAWPRSPHCPRPAHPPPCR